MENDLQGYFMIGLVIISIILVIAGFIKESNESKEKHLQHIRWAKEKEEEEKRIERLIQIEKDALREWMEGIDDVNKLRDTVTFTLKKQTSLEYVNVNYPNLYKKHCTDYLNLFELDDSAYGDYGNRLMVYIILKEFIHTSLRSLELCSHYNMNCYDIDGGGDVIKLTEWEEMKRNDVFVNKKLGRLNLPPIYGKQRKL